MDYRCDYRKKKVGEMRCDIDVIKRGLDLFQKTAVI
jgi:hypothetical protein